MSTSRPDRPYGADLRVAVLVGSAREGSGNRRLAALAADHAPAGVRLEVVDGLEQLPFYDPALDAAGVPAAERVRAAVAAADALLVVSPEHNGGMPAVLTNAVDWLSRPFRAGALAGTPAAVIGTAAGRYGGLWAHEHGRRVLGVAGARVVEGAELSLPSAALEDADLPGRLVAVLEALRADAAALAA